MSLGNFGYLLRKISNVVYLNTYSKNDKESNAKSDRLTKTMAEETGKDGLKSSEPPTQGGGEEETNVDITTLDQEPKVTPAKDEKKADEHDEEPTPVDQRAPEKVLHTRRSSDPPKRKEVSCEKVDWMKEKVGYSVDFLSPALKDQLKKRREMMTAEEMAQYMEMNELLERGY